jgi:hypothetical protein
MNAASSVAALLQEEGRFSTDHSQPRAGQSFNFNLLARDGVMAMTGR